MAGDLGNAYYKGGRQVLNDIVNVFRDIQQKKEQRDSLNRMMDFFGKTGESINSLGNATETQTEIAPNQFYKPTDNNLISDKLGLGNQNVSSLNNPLGQMVRANPTGLSTIDPNEMARQYTGTPTYQKKTEIPIPQQERYNRAQDEVNSFMLKAITNPENKNVDPNVLKIFTDVLSQRAERLKPETYSYADEDPTKRMVRISNKTGQREIINEGIPKRNVKVIDESLNEQGHKIVEYEDEFGKRFTEDKGIDYKFVADQKRQEAADKRLAAAISSKEKGVDISDESGKVEGLKSQLSDLDNYFQKDNTGKYVNSLKDGNWYFNGNVYTPEQINVVINNEKQKIKSQLKAATKTLSQKSVKQKATDLSPDAMDAYNYLINKGKTQIEALDILKKEGYTK